MTSPLTCVFLDLGMKPVQSMKARKGYLIRLSNVTTNEGQRTGNSAATAASVGYKK